MKIQSEGCSTMGLLFIAFVILKLTHYIDWSWWWICAPIWIPILIIFAIVFFALVCAIAFHWNDFFGSPKHQRL